MADEDVVAGEAQVAVGDPDAGPGPGRVDVVVRLTRAEARAQDAGSGRLARATRSRSRARLPAAARGDGQGLLGEDGRLLDRRDGIRLGLRRGRAPHEGRHGSTRPGEEGLVEARGAALELRHLVVVAAQAGERPRVQGAVGRLGVLAHGPDEVVGEGAVVDAVDVGVGRGLVVPAAADERLGDVDDVDVLVSGDGGGRGSASP